MYAYQSLTGALTSIIRAGPSEIFRGFSASALRDAPYAGLFLMFYEGIKRETGKHEHSIQAYVCVHMFIQLSFFLRHLYMAFLQHQLEL